MKSIILSLLFFAQAVLLFSQHNNSEIPTSIRADGIAPDGSAMLDVQSTTKGMLIPRMDSTQRKVISSPAQGLLVFDTDFKSFWFHNGSIWIDLSSSVTNTILGANMISDIDGDTRIDLEGSGDEDVIIMELGGTPSQFSIHRNNVGDLIFSPSNPFTNAPNVLFGFGSGINMDTSGFTNHGKFNSFFGTASGGINTTGYDNTFIGYSSGFLNQIGNENAFLGSGAGFSNITGNNNVFIGNASGYFSDSTSNLTFVGYQAGHSNTDGFSNTYIGYKSGYTNATGNFGTFLGFSAGEHNSSGWNNTSTRS